MTNGIAVGRALLVLTLAALCGCGSRQGPQDADNVIRQANEDIAAAAESDRAELESLRRQVDEARQAAEEAQSVAREVADDAQRIRRDLGRFSYEDWGSVVPDIDRAARRLSSRSEEAATQAEEVVTALQR